MNDESVTLNPCGLALEQNPADVLEEIGNQPKPLEFTIEVPANAWPVAQASARELAVLPLFHEKRTNELVLSGTQLLLAAASALGSIFLLVWAVINLWLTES